VLEVHDFGATVTSIILKKPSQFKTACKDDSGYITQLKQLKQEKIKSDIT